MTPIVLALLVSAALSDPPAPGPARALSASGEVFPADPIEPGDCALRLAVHDAATGAPVASKVRLWRLDAPGNEWWGPGDQCQREVAVPAEGLTIEGLAAGRYRAVALAAALGSDDPPGFAVDGVETSVALAIATPGERLAWLRLYDHAGAPIDRARLRVGSRSRSPRLRAAPAWVEKRELVREPEVWAGGGGGGSFSTSRGCGGSPPPFVEAGPRGFRLGPFEDDSKGERRSASVTAETESGETVWVRVSGLDEGDREYVAVAVPAAVAAERVVRADGLAVDPALLWIRCRPILRADAKTNTPWLEVPIDVEVRTLRQDEFEPFEFTFRLGDERRPPHVLTPKGG